MTRNEPKESSLPPTSVKRDENPVEEKQTKQKKQKKQKKQQKQKKPKTVNGHIHYSSSSDSSSESSSESDSAEDSANKTGKEQKREIDADGNEVIFTSNDVWKTSVEVEHTENENMDDFINQLFLLSVYFIQIEKKHFTALAIKKVQNTFSDLWKRSSVILFLRARETRLCNIRVLYSHHFSSCAKMNSNDTIHDCLTFGRLREVLPNILNLTFL